tara:strand:+ start:397 stop:645 length:249 start_codon:yes stop_codon:yes gene_type:complete
MSSTGRKSKNTSDTQLDESSLPRGERPTIIERGKKFAAYDKNGRLIILGYNRQIIQEYADAQSKIRFERQRKNRSRRARNNA